MRSGPLLLTTEIEQHRPLGFAGEPIYLLHRKLAAVVANRLGEGAAGYFARPEIDEINHRINWHATAEGEVRRWIDLSSSEQSSLLPKLAALQQSLGSLVATLERAGDKGPAQENFGRALRLGLRSPGIEYLYVVGDHLVLALWGFEGGNRPFDTLTFAPVPAPAQVTMQPQSAAAVRTPRPWWHWLLWLLGLLALLLLIMLVLRSCFHVPIPVGDNLLPPAEAPAPEQPGEPSIVEPHTTMISPGGAIVERDGSGVGVSPHSEVPATPSDAPPEGDAAPDASAPPTNSEPETAPSQPESPAGEEPTPSDAAPGESEPETAPSQPESPAGEEPTPSDAAPGESPPEPSAETPATSEEGAPEPTPPETGEGAEQTEPLNLPPQGQSGNATDLGFLEGEWRSAGGLYDKSTGKPLTQLYRFDTKGQGTVVIRRGDGVECTAKAQASRTTTGGLKIQEAGPIECPDGKRFAPAVTECTRADNGQAKCQGTNRAGSDYNVEITR
jgi:hypothetical protein